MKTAALGLQHVLAMYAGAILVPLIVGAALGLTSEQLTYLVAIDILMCGVATILQVVNNRFFGIGLPVVLGCTFTAVGPMIAIGGQYGISAIYGAILVSGDRKSTRLNSSHVAISYAVFCFQKKKRRK